jgi:hypothetical protein
LQERAGMNDLTVRACGYKYRPLLEGDISQVLSLFNNLRA